MKNILFLSLLLAVSYSFPAKAFNNVLMMKKKKAVGAGPGACPLDNTPGVTGFPAGWGLAGSGCDSSNVIVQSIGPGKWSIHFKNFCAASGTANFKRVNCNIAIPVSVPAGKKVRLDAANLSGKYTLLAGGSAQPNIETFFSGFPGNPTSSLYNGPDNTSFSLIAAPPSNTGSCGVSVNLRANISIRANQAGNVALISDLTNFGYTLVNCP